MGNPTGVPGLAVPGNATKSVVEHGIAKELINSYGTAFFRGDDLDDDTQEIINQLDKDGDKATIGSSTSSDTNDPSIAGQEASAYFTAFDAVNNFYTTASPTNTNPNVLDVRSDIEFPGSNFSVSTRTWSGRAILSFSSAGVIQFVYRADGTFTTHDFATAYTSLSGRYQIRVVLDKVSSTIKLFYRQNEGGGFDLSSDADWPLIEEDTETLTTFEVTTAIVGGSATIPGPTKTYRNYHKLDDEVIDFNPTEFDGEQGNYTDPRGRLWQITRASSGLKGVMVKANKSLVQSDGTDDYIQLPPAATPSTITESAGSYSCILVGNRYDDGDDFDALVDFKSASNNGLELRCVTAAGQIQAVYRGPTTVSAISSVASDVWVSNDPVAVGLAVETGSLYVFNDDDGLSSATSMAGDGDATYADGRIFCVAHGVTQTQDADFRFFASFNKRLTESEFNAVSAYLRSLI